MISSPASLSGARRDLALVEDLWIGIGTDSTPIAPWIERAQFILSMVSADLAAGNRALYGNLMTGLSRLAEIQGGAPLPVEFVQHSIMSDREGVSTRERLRAALELELSLTEPGSAARAHVEDAIRAYTRATLEHRFAELRELDEQDFHLMVPRA